MLNRVIILVACILALHACAFMPGKTAPTVNTNDIKIAPQNYHSAISAAKKGKTRTAIKLLTEITKNNPDFSPAYTNLGLQQLKNNKHKQAEITLKKAVKINKSDAVAYNHLGIIMRMKGEFSNAQSMYQQAIKSDSSYANAHLNLGILLDIYLYELADALEHYNSYQTLTNNNDKLVSKWIIDIKRRIESAKKKNS